MAPVNLINLESVSKGFGGRAVLDEVSLGIAVGERIGVVGRNGGGKTTLLNILSRDESPDSGRVTHSRDLRIGALPQTAALPTAGLIRDVVLGADSFAAEHEWAGDAGIRAVLDGLGLHGLGLDSEVGRLSGGERRRVALAARLVHDTDLLVLDEPTNHLDVEGVAWLAEHLIARRGALLVVTHDRWFLDAVVRTTWEVADGAVRSYDGGYAAYVLARAERDRLDAATEARRANLMRKELAWLRRGPPARTSKPQFRIDAAQALIEDEPPARDSVAIQAFATRRLGKTVYDVEDVTVTVGADRRLLDDVTWRVGPGDRIGIVGINGSGKSTLMRLLVGDLAPDIGRVVVGKTVAPAYLSQEVTELPSTLRVLEAVTEIASRATLGGVEMSASSLAERFGFPAAQQWTPVGELSGGERRRLQLLRLLMAEPNVLLLDEPTNDLDIDTLTALEDLLDSWAGTVIVVSHDRYLVERVCDSVVALLGDGKLATLPGGVEEYLTRRRAIESSTDAPATQSRGDSRTGQAQARASRKELGRLERQIATLQRREAALHDDLAKHATDYEKVAELNATLLSVVAQREEHETQWLELADELD
ncbi:MAG TPA: ABC-F family ATP-binding cassette domain-containing protein [Mycobacteriales bacterium]|jgi:ATP-binding cassette subfamily F protein uup|nr:ABC-F family ATP-binding cassette domain-containing protein [Mycobacteriales bacterium]